MFLCVREQKLTFSLCLLYIFTPSTLYVVFTNYLFMAVYLRYSSSSAFLLLRDGLCGPVVDELWSVSQLSQQFS